ncbi:MAG: helix-turn-helix transcriptional regulator [Deltaproteobacteria bacterium]|jgi:transcriptional regulator with XRE-family HTH domain|nr:helix-turn-helix transcriptional regulator [Deltaproteobacteria bacterium]
MEKSDFDNTFATVCLDSSKIKWLRESQKLTQLYVSKVVGVTTDTVSRWENNRYPTIRRENAIKLAEALETTLDELLRKPEENNLPADQPRVKLPYIFLGLAAILIVVFAIMFAIVSKPAPPLVTVNATRVLPKHAAPGARIPVMVELTQVEESGGFIVRENFPKGWKMIQSSPPTSSLDNINGVARWIVKNSDELKRIVYLIQVSSKSRTGTQGSFHGEIIVGGDRSQAVVSTGGDLITKVAPIHWADTDGNGQVNDVEMLQASYTIEDMAGVHIDWNALESLWDAGQYQWDKKKRDFVPAPPENKEKTQ